MSSLMHVVELDGDWVELAAADTYDSFGFQIDGHGTAAIAVATTIPAADATDYIILRGRDDGDTQSFSMDLPAGYAVYGRQLGQKPAVVRGYRVPSA